MVIRDNRRGQNAARPFDDCHVNAWIMKVDEYEFNVVKVTNVTNTPY